MRNPTVSFLFDTLISRLSFQKNRFSNILLFNEGAVILERKNKDETTYIHATRIKSNFGNYILAQSPTSNTLLEWYRMIWQYKIQIIVCLVPLDNLDDCCKYFEKKKGKKVKVGFNYQD
jgi:protein tyrosine phosphatase